MIRHFATRLIMMLCALLASASIAAAQNWNGDWSSNFGQLRLLQNGDRLYGDYADRGAIEGRISADGRTARLVFYNGTRWGTAQWRIVNDKISGSWAWAWANEGPARPKGKPWTATRTSSRTSPIRFADQIRVKYPDGDPQFTETIEPWLNAIARAQPAPAPDVRDGLSDWYAGFELTSIDPHFDITAEIIHYRRSNTAAADLSIFVGPQRDCPTTMHVSFCDELMARADNRGYVDVETIGVTVINLGNIGETVEIVFRLVGDRSDRVMRIAREATYFNASIHHPVRGFDYAGFAQSRDHLCQQTQCQDAVFRDIRDNPARYRGNVNRGALVRMINLPNRIAQSHNTSRPAPAPAPQPAPMPRSLLSDAWTILEETSENLGEISISPDGRRLKAAGKLRGFFNTSDDHDTIFTHVAATDEAVAFDLTVYAGQSGESKQGRLLIELPSYAAANPRGTLIVGDEILLVELVAQIPGLDPRQQGDTPAIGIYSTGYRLRDVPLGRSVTLRAQATRSSGITGTISPDARDLQIVQCDAEINSLRFMQASFEGKMELLEPHWCQVTDGRIAGWLEGRFLVPENN